VRRGQANGGDFQNPTTRIGGGEWLNGVGKITLQERASTGGQPLPEEFGEEARGGGGKGRFSVQKHASHRGILPPFIGEVAETRRGQVAQEKRTGSEKESIVGRAPWYESLERRRRGEQKRSLRPTGRGFLAGGANIGTT